MNANLNINNVSTHYASLSELEQDAAIRDTSVEVMYAIAERADDTVTLESTMKAHIYYATEAMWDRHGQYDMLINAQNGNAVKSDITGDAASYRMVREFDAVDLNSVFIAMQGENWSPNGEARFLIKSLGLCHTSMSVGDAVHFPETGKLYLCDRCGWVEITNA